MKGLLIDFGGVLTTNVFDSFKAFCRAEGLPEDTVKNMFRERGEGLGLLRRLEKGELSAEEFSQQFAPLLGVDSGNLVERLFGGIGPDEAMLGAVRRSRAAGIKTGLISNSWGDGLAYDQALLDELFDALVISGEVGMHKPEPEIFHLGAERIGVAPEDCVFVDDLRENCAGAEAVGMKAILHRGAEGTLPQLEELLGVPLSDAGARA
ncbi:MAG: putative hydrolase of the superfamily [Thermoleophilaceae bacterium]|nr:putative hydrolase of the superfamily [Thermoleophilaceae bacterium]